VQLRSAASRDDQVEDGYYAWLFASDLRGLVSAAVDQGDSAAERLLAKALARTPRQRCRKDGRSVARELSSLILLKKNGAAALSILVWRVWPNLSLATRHFRCEVK
jgi:hypothetical protein